MEAWTAIGPIVARRPGGGEVEPVEVGAAGYVRRRARWRPRAARACTIRRRLGPLPVRRPALRGAPAGGIPRGPGAKEIPMADDALRRLAANTLRTLAMDG
ncbi:MAG TPA: hypothetical protein PLP50_11560, partial [Thermoanaerobaculia bacterium]|nr:hypothetical protein [Thermoanaerobaculia bacterium]